MGSMVTETIVGRLGRDAEARATSNGKNVTQFSVAADVGYGEKKQTLWRNVTVWGKSGEFCANLQKGETVAVTGRLELDSWIDRQSGEEKKKENLIAYDVQRVSPPIDSAVQGEKPQGKKRVEAPQQQQAAATDEPEDDIPF